MSNTVVTLQSTSGHSHPGRSPAWITQKSNIKTLANISVVV